MRLKIRDREAAYSHVDQKDPLDVFDIGTEFDDEAIDQLCEWIRPLHLDDEERNPSPTVAREARAEGINVERVIQEEVIGPDRESIDALVGRANILISSRSSQVPSRTNENSSTRSGGSSSIRGDDSGSYGGGGDDVGVQDYNGSQPGHMSPFTCEPNFTHATQDGDHGSRRAGSGIGAIGKHYTPRERGQGRMSTHEYDFLSTFDSSSVGGGNDGPYTYGQNLTMPYSTYSMPYGVQSTESSDTSWSQSDVQSSNDYGYGQGQALPNPYNFQYGNPQSIPLDPYGWHVSQYMQNYKGEVSFNDYSSQYTEDSTQRNDEDSENYVPHRSSMWL